MTYKRLSFGGYLQFNDDGTLRDWQYVSGDIPGFIEDREIQEMLYKLFIEKFGFHR